MKIANLDETTLRYHATDKSCQRGEAYYQQGAVVDLFQRGKCLCGEVEGNGVEPYHVNIEFDAGGVTEAECTCWRKRGLLIFNLDDKLNGTPIAPSWLRHMDASANLWA